MDNYIIKCYDILHTHGKEYLVKDITDEKYLDFGRKFYITTFKNQAKKEAEGMTDDFLDDYDDILCYGISFFKKRCRVKKNV